LLTDSVGGRGDVTDSENVGLPRHLEREHSEEFNRLVLEFLLED
jgi:hypothetical protein